MQAPRTGFGLDHLTADPHVNSFIYEPKAEMPHWASARLHFCHSRRKSLSHITFVVVLTHIGAAASRSVIVPDVAARPGHIACDAATQSEIVVPLIACNSGQVVGVLDLDSEGFTRSHHAIISRTDFEHWSQRLEALMKRINMV